MIVEKIVRKIRVLHAKRFIYPSKKKYLVCIYANDDSFKVNALEKRVSFDSRRIHWGVRFYVTMRKLGKKKQKNRFTEIIICIYGGNGDFRFAV